MVAVAVAAGEVVQLLAPCASPSSITAPDNSVAVTLAPAVVGAGLTICGVVAMLKQKLKLLPEIFVWLGQPETAVMVWTPS